MPIERISSLVDKFFADDCTPAEKEELAVWIDQAADDDVLKELLSAAWQRHEASHVMPGEMSGRIVMGIFGKTRAGAGAVEGAGLVSGTGVIVGAGAGTGEEMGFVAGKGTGVVRREAEDGGAQMPAMGVWNEEAQGQMVDAGNGGERHPVVVRMVRWIAAAALIGLLGTGAWWLFHQQRGTVPESRSTGPVASLPYKGDVGPGHNGAILHLSNGQEVVLDSVQNGIVATQDGKQVIKEDGRIRYVNTGAGVQEEGHNGEGHNGEGHGGDDRSEKGHGGEVVYNDITTARGRQWQLTLPDGSRVWLNAASSIHYPLSFASDVREVSITGEVYFEVAHHTGQAFRVKVGDQVIEDIGTAFNINAYNDEPVVKTTLAEGAIRVSRGTASVLVKPGEQVSEQNGRLQVAHGNVEQATAWRRGVFSCRHATIPELMRQLARWYNVDVEYKGSISPEVTFTGDMSRNLSLAQVLHGLRSMDINFRIEEDKKIVVLP